ncbi:MAG: hypothetical protein ACLTAF_02520 [Blautia coccoides]
MVHRHSLDVNYKTMGAGAVRRFQQRIKREKVNKIAGELKA